MSLGGERESAIHALASGWRRGTGRIREENVDGAWIQGGKCSWLTKRAPGFGTKAEGGVDGFYERRLLQQEATSEML